VPLSSHPYLPCCQRTYRQQGPFAPRPLRRFLARTDPSAPLSSSADFPEAPVIRPTGFRRLRDGRRRASPVAWRVLVPVRPLPPRRRGASSQPVYAAPCCLHPHGCGLGLRGWSFSGPPLRSLALRPGDSPSSCDDAVDGLQVLGFPPPCPLATRRLALPLAGLSPAERASLYWTHNRAGLLRNTRLKQALTLRICRSGCEHAARTPAPVVRLMGPFAES
jgi:hypothetical protein